MQTDKRGLTEPGWAYSIFSHSYHMIDKLGIVNKQLTEPSRVESVRGLELRLES